MNAHSGSPRGGRDLSTLLAVGLVAAGLVAIVGLVWASWTRLMGHQSVPITQPSPTPLVVTGTAVPTERPGTLPPPRLAVTEAQPTLEATEPLPTSPAASPTAVPEPTPTPTATPRPTPFIQAGDDGVNVRTGPGLNYDLQGYLSPGAQAPVAGRSGTWWQIQYEQTLGWVYGEIVTALHAEDVPQVRPPPSPTRAPTAVPTATPEPPPTPDLRGLVPNAYWVEGAPGPFGVNQEIWFNMDITNGGGGAIAYGALGTWVEPTGQFQQSWADSSFQPGQRFTWRDHLHIPAGGTYNLWLRICFTDGVCLNLLGPVTITVQ